MIVEMILMMGVMLMVRMKSAEPDVLLLCQDQRISCQTACLRLMEKPSIRR